MKEKEKQNKRKTSASKNLFSVFFICDFFQVFVILHRGGKGYEVLEV